MSLLRRLAHWLRGSSAYEGGKAGTLRVLLALIVPATVAIVAYAIDPGSILAIATLIATGAFVLGALLGFLFGIPQYQARQGDPPADRPSYQPNTNLTQVSDWLTKIIIGLGLVQFGQLVESIGELGDEFAPSLGGEPAGRTFAIALVVGFFVIGLLVGYLYTRLRLQWAFARADRDAFDEASLTEIRLAERVRPLPREDDGVEVGDRPSSADPNADYRAVVERVKSRLRFVRLILDLEAEVGELEYAAIASRLRADLLIDADEERFVLDLLGPNPDLSDWPSNTREEFLDSAWSFATRFGPLIWDRAVRKRLRASGWFVTEYGQERDHRPDFLAYRDEEWAVMAARVAGNKGNPYKYVRSAKRLADFAPTVAVSGRCFVIPDIREGTVAEQYRYRSDKPEGVKVLKLLTLVDSSKAAFDETNDDVDERVRAGAERGG